MTIHRVLQLPISRQINLVTKFFQLKNLKPISAERITKLNQLLLSKSLGVTFSFYGNYPYKVNQGIGALKVFPVALFCLSKGLASKVINHLPARQSDKFRVELRCRARENISWTLFVHYHIEVWEWKRVWEGEAVLITDSCSIGRSLGWLFGVVMLFGGINFGEQKFIPPGVVRSPFFSFLLLFLKVFVS